MLHSPCPRPPACNGVSRPIGRLQLWLRCPHGVPREASSVTPTRPVDDCCAHPRALHTCATNEEMTACRLLQLGEDQQRTIFQLLSNALRPVIALQLSACCHELRSVSADVRTALLRQHGAARRLCYQVRTSVAAVSEAKELLWYGQGLTAAHMATLRMLMSTNALRRLEVLNISINKFAAEGMQALCAEPGHGSLPRLRFLDLTGNALGSVGAAALAAALGRGALPQLEILKLGRNNIGDQGLAALAPPLRGLPVLEVLDLHSNQIGDEGVELLLANLSEKQLKQLKTLNLAGNLINDAGRAVLIAALHDDGRALPPLGVLRIDKAG